ncbi:DUF167 domain-containing protein [Vulgatibacter incomptus]|uniref:UPF0235 protein AKJ08_0794 n=1 Tax=Vulgatibacter incomptus TaxID=1391653 RepID=A0A0K1PA78_9BACT|nr:DUF167 domain-containing protein [Vulgatibacter incomptus]AKU90407.1 hypothetical protein AKJ08_0794 [Vulgatibacter incomptus]
MAPWLRVSADSVLVEVVVQPRASRSRVVGEHDGRLKVQLTAPPVDGEANAALIELISDLVGIPRRAVEISAGSTGRRKTLRLTGAKVELVEAALSPEAS